MSALTRQQRIAALRDTIANIERKPAFAVAATAHVRDGFTTAVPGQIQEIFAQDRRSTSASLGFALAQARHLLTPARPAVVHLQMLDDAQNMGLPYGPGLSSFGFSPDALVLIRPANIVELLWAAEEALACTAVAAVIADVAGQPKALNFTASRRLNLRAEATGATLFALRYGVWREASAAQIRWSLTPAVSARNRLDPSSPGQTRWLVHLEKGATTVGKTEFMLGWTHNGFKLDTVPPSTRDIGRAALPRPVSARLGDHLSEAS